MENERKWVSHYDEDMSISVQVPVNWSRSSNKDFRLLLMAEEREGFSVNVGINEHRLSGGKDAFMKAIQSSNESLQNSYKAYTKLKEEECWIDGFPAYHQLYSWESDNGDITYIQSLTLIYDLTSRLFEINGTTTKSLPKDNIELIEHIIDSIRLINMS